MHINIHAQPRPGVPSTDRRYTDRPTSVTSGEEPSKSHRDRPSWRVLLATPTSRSLAVNVSPRMFVHSTMIDAAGPEEADGGVSRAYIRPAETAVERT